MKSTTACRSIGCVVDSVPSGWLRAPRARDRPKRADRPVLLGVRPLDEYELVEGELSRHLGRMCVENDLPQGIVGADRSVDVDRVVPEQFGQIRYSRGMDAVLGLLDAQHGAVLNVHQHQDQGDVPQRAVREGAAVQPVFHPGDAGPQGELISNVVGVDSQLRDVRVELPEAKENLALCGSIPRHERMERGRYVAARSRDVGRCRPGVGGAHRARLEVENAPG